LGNEPLDRISVTVRIATIIFVVEAFIMFVFAFLDANLNPYIEAVIDISVLIGVSTPLIYRWVISPYIIAKNDAIEQLNQLAHTDLLTNISNRRDIYNHLERIVSASTRHDFHAAVMLLDLDGFKYINDTFGHEAGDAVLVKTAQRLVARIRSEDIAGRLGGDEFIIILNYIAPIEKAKDCTSALANQLIQTISEPISFKGETLNVSVSIGVRMFGDKTEGAESIVHDADAAMYQAKGEGKGCAVMFGLDHIKSAGQLY